jgi:hypothetical protein
MLKVHKLTVCNDMGNLRHYNSELSYLYNLAVCCILRTHKATLMMMVKAIETCW